ncbi:MAG: SpoIIIAH-like family protein [Clostridia bacterium]|nr:SpoIIIAH-like family protein [Clostridia bacterium]
MKKKLIVVAVLAVMLGITGYVNYVGERSELAAADTDDEYIPVGEAVPISSESIKEVDYFQKAKIDREAERAETIDLLNNMINNPNTTADSKVNAENRLAAIADNISVEAAAEGLIKAKGYHDAVVYIGESSVNVVVAAETLTAGDTAKIRDIVFEQTNNNNIKIVAVK